MAHRRATIIFNPMSGRPGRRAENAREMVRLLGERGIEAEARATTAPDDATRLAREAIERGADIIVSYGGDGTLNEVLQAMIGSRAALAVWPGGTANVVAVDLGMPSNIIRLADIIAGGKQGRIAVGLARSGGGDEAGPRAERYFFMFAGIGLDASIARNVNMRLKRRTGEFAFWVEGMKHLITWDAEPFVVDVDGQEYESTFTLIGNGKGYGGGICMTPDARLEEPWFELYILPPLPGKAAYLGELVTCLRGRLERSRARLVRGRHIKVNSSHRPWVEVDGEIIGPLPMTFDIVPDALSIIVP
jgi:YegS/Rv2252/BmrU family lipid kinase